MIFIFKLNIKIKNMSNEILKPHSIFLRSTIKNKYNGIKFRGLQVGCGSYVYGRNWDCAKRAGDYDEICVCFECFHFFENNIQIIQKYVRKYVLKKN